MIMCILIFQFTLGAEESQSIWSFIPESMHHIRVAVATQEHYQKSGRHLKNCQGGLWIGIKSIQVHTVTQKQDQTWNYGLEVSLACILFSQLIESRFGEFSPCTVWKTEVVRTQSSLACPGAPALQVLLIRKLKLVVLYFFLAGM